MSGEVFLTTGPAVAADWLLKAAAKAKTVASNADRSRLMGSLSIISYKK